MYTRDVYRKFIMFKWLDAFHINRYVRKMDNRTFNRPNRSATENAGFRRLIEKERRRRFKDDLRVDNPENRMKDDV